MSHLDYVIGLDISAGKSHVVDPPFSSIIMAAFRKADSDNIERLKLAFPEIWQEFWARYNSPGGYLGGEL